MLGIAGGIKRGGVGSALLWLGLYLILMSTSVWRLRLCLAYDRWRRLHLTLAIAAVDFGLAHLHAGDFTRRRCRAFC